MPVETKKPQNIMNFGDILIRKVYFRKYLKPKTLLQIVCDIMHRYISGVKASFGNSKFTHDNYFCEEFLKISISSK